MTRIIAGEFGGRRIDVPKRGTRPTTDRVREAIFSSLEARGAIQGARVFDGFAGSGALGFEALSRGAQSVTLVDNNGPAVAALRANAAILGVTSRASVMRGDVTTVLGRTGEPFDLVFLDPPYEGAVDALRPVLAALFPRLAEGAVVVVEAAARAGALPWPEAVQPEITRDYGETSIHYGRRGVNPRSD